MWTLAEGDVTSVPFVENTDVELAYKWYYAKKVKELNELRVKIATIKATKD
jgi:hypothetical protein